jgi:hypothetical protein
MKKLNITGKTAKDGTYYKSRVNATIVEWNRHIKMFYHLFDGIYYLTEYSSGSILTKSKDLIGLRKNFDRMIRKYGVMTLKKRSKRVIRISKLTAN